MTSEEEGRAKPPLSQVPSSASLSSVVHLVGRVCLCHCCEQTQWERTEIVWAEENGQHRPGDKPQLRHQARSDLHLLVHQHRYFTAQILSNWGISIVKCWNNNNLWSILTLNLLESVLKLHTIVCLVTVAPSTATCQLDVVMFRTFNDSARNVGLWWLP